MSAPVPFSERLSDLLAERNRDQAWLARISGVEASTISRLLNNKRQPAFETLEVLAPALGITVEQLVQGTTVAERARVGPDLVPIEQFQNAVATLLELERRANAAEAMLADARQSLQDEQRARKAARAELDEVREQLERAVAEKERLVDEVDQHRAALEKAVADIWQLRAHLGDIEQIAKSASKTGRTTAVLAAIAAITGTATVAHYLGQKKPGTKRAKRAKV